MKKRVSLILILGILVGSLTACGTKPSKAGGENKLVIGLECGYAPFNWTQIDGSNAGVAIDGNKEYAGGYDIEIAKRLAGEMNRELVVVKTDWAGLVPALISGKIDLIMAGMSPSKERREAIDFSDAYYKSDLVMIVKKDGKYKDAKNLEDFKGAKLTGQLATLHYDVIDQVDGAIKEPAMEDFPAMRVALESGIIDGYVAEKPEGQSTEAFNDSFKMIELDKGFDVSEEEITIAVGMEKDSQMKDEINRILKKISAEERDQIMKEAVLNQPAVK